MSLVPMVIKRTTDGERSMDLFSRLLDEAQYYLNEYDSLFQSTARSSRACTIYITQNITSYEAQMKGYNSQSIVYSFLGNLQTKIFHANSDTVTNKYASDLIAKAYSIRRQTSISGNTNQSYQQHIVLEDQVMPKEFAELKNGGEKNDYRVEAITYQTGRQWESNNGKNFGRVVFDQ
jgi:hypothetical protein